MNEPNPDTNTAGSQWRRWDPHIHSPGTMLNDQFGGDWETFLQKLESATPAIHALGITDYCSIQGYRTVRAHQRDGRLQNIGLIFPNVEFRLDVKTEKAKGINLHLLFSPHDPDHEGHIERLLGSLRFEYKETQYACTPASLAQLGRAFHDNPLDEEAAVRAGTNQFKASLTELKALFKDPWMQRNALVAVSGNGVDGTAGLYDTSHIRVEYGIQFDGVAIEQLSPGTRGIVLLLLYLAIDKRDQRPLIVDQPEENLDPQSVYEELVPHFRDARKRRQVILVTHNANLVVNTDADQVIIASAHRMNDDGLPEISYQAGSLEDPEIRQAVCNILEGGNRAFLERERRYRFRWEETIAS